MRGSPLVPTSLWHGRGVIRSRGPLRPSASCLAHCLRGGSIGSGRTDQSRVDGQLGSVEERQTISDHFQATVIQLASCKRSRSWTLMLVDTLAPASVQMRAAQLSNGNPRRPSTRCSVESSGWPHRQQADERGSGHQRRRRRRTRKHCDAVDVGEQWNGIPAMGLAVNGRALAQWVPTLATLHSGRRCPPLWKKRRSATRCVTFWGTRHPGQTLDAALEPRRTTLGRQHQLQQGDICTHWLPPNGTHQHLWRVTQACGLQRLDDVCGSGRVSIQLAQCAVDPQPLCVSQAQTSQRKWKTCHFPHVLCDWNAQERLETLPDPSIMHLRESEGQHMIDTRARNLLGKRRTTRAKKPSTLEIGDFRDSVQKNSIFFNFLLKLATKSVPQWSAENGDALLVRGKIVVSAPHTSWFTKGIEEKMLAIRGCLPGKNSTLESSSD